MIERKERLTWRAGKAELKVEWQKQLFETKADTGQP